MPEDFRTAALARFDDARVLLANERWTGAPYMARLGLECNLKDKLLRKQRLKRLPARWYPHDLWRLLKGASQRVPKAIAIAVAEINAVDVNIRYNEEVLDQRTVERFLAKIRGISRWLDPL